jgi:hypothetical protein
MAPIKLEEHIKEQLEERRIQPSAAGWERLSGQLELQKGKKKSKRVLWMSIAASFIIGVGVTAVLLQDTSTTINTLVEVPDTQDVQEENIEKGILNDNTTQEVAEIQAPESIQENESAQETIEQNKVIVPEQSQTINRNINEAVAVSAPSIKPENVLPVSSTKETIVNNTPDLDFTITQKVQEVVAQVENQEGITDKEIDDLLLNARRDIISKQLLNPETNRVDASALLLDVEAEVDPDTFKDKIFRTLKQEFGKAVDAVVNRNN